MSIAASFITAKKYSNPNDHQLKNEYVSCSKEYYLAKKKYIYIYIVLVFATAWMSLENIKLGLKSQSQ